MQRISKERRDGGSFADCKIRREERVSFPKGENRRRGEGPKEQEKVVEGSGFYQV